MTHENPPTTAHPWDGTLHDRLQPARIPQYSEQEVTTAQGQALELKFQPSEIREIEKRMLPLNR